MRERKRVAAASKAVDELSYLATAVEEAKLAIRCQRERAAALIADVAEIDRNLVITAQTLAAKYREFLDAEEKINNLQKIIASTVSAADQYLAAARGEDFDE